MSRPCLSKNDVSVPGCPGRWNSAVAPGMSKRRTVPLCGCHPAAGFSAYRRASIEWPWMAGGSAGSVPPSAT
ncbi:Uncharacterised protein [Mycobacteroides abscessus subsp. abscessus]|nr:Uncharacterised protein [Mycobacteroides abscessus subsp. abscessus]